jgi:hypothetical protein
MLFILKKKYILDGFFDSTDRQEFWDDRPLFKDFKDIQTTSL